MAKFAVSFSQQVACEVRSANEWGQSRVNSNSHWKWLQIVPTELILPFTMKQFEQQEQKSARRGLNKLKRKLCKPAKKKTKPQNHSALLLEGVVWMMKSNPLCTTKTGVSETKWKCLKDFYFETQTWLWYTSNKALSSDCYVCELYCAEVAPVETR